MAEIDSERVALAGQQGVIEIVDINTRQRIIEKRVSRLLSHAALGTAICHIIGLEHVKAIDGKRFFAACSMTKFFVMDAETLDVRGSLPGIFASFDCKFSSLSSVR